MEIAKFILTAVGTFLSVFALSFTIFQYWRKKQDEKFTELKSSVLAGIRDEKAEREKSIVRLEHRLEKIENFGERLSKIEGEIRGLKTTLIKYRNGLSEIHRQEERDGTYILAA